MNAIYYVEINFTCIALLIFLRLQAGRRYNGLSTRKIIFTRLLQSAIVLCVADMVAGICRGQVFPGAKVLIEISNLLFFEILSLIAFLWLFYVELTLGRITLANQKKIWLIAIPLIAFSVITVTNPFTSILFSIDSNNLYVRGNGVLIHWLILWAYLIVPTVRTALAITREKNKSRRRELIPLLYFIIAPALSGVAQMLFYGVTSTQVGITLSLVLISLNELGNQIGTDTLTSLNNRSGLDRYISGSLQGRSSVRFTVVMIDVNSFKQINDRFGHLTGDHALSDMAEALRETCDGMVKKSFLCRFGGDEFLIVGRDFDDEDVPLIKQSINEALERINQTGANLYTLSAAIGAASGECADSDDAERLICMADEAMYDDKKRRKAPAKDEPDDALHLN